MQGDHGGIYLGSCTDCFVKPTVSSGWDARFGEFNLVTVEMEDLRRDAYVAKVAPSF